MSASGVSGLTPMAPWIWIARSATRVSTDGTAALIMEMSLRAAEAPTVSISQAARSTSSRAWALFMQVLAESFSVLGALAHQFERQFGKANCPHAMVDAPGAKAGLRHGKAAAFLAEQVLDRYADVAEDHFAMTDLGKMVE